MKEHVAQVWETSPYGGTRLLIHLTLAEYADEDGRFFVSQKALSERCRCSIESVRISL